MKNSICLIFIFFVLSLNITFSLELNIEKGRELYSKASLNENNLNIATNYFEKLKSINKNTNLNPIINIYLGSLTTINAKFEFFPHKKYECALNGLEIMEKQINTTNSIEAMYIYAATCNQLPFFFNKQETSEYYFGKILNKISENDMKENPKMIIQLFDYVKNKTKYNKDFSQKIDLLKKNYLNNIE